MSSSSAVYTVICVVEGRTFNQNRTVDANGSVIQDPTLAVAKTGTLATRTNAHDGTLTMAGGHGITDGQRLDLYWSGGQRYGLLVGTVSGNSVPFTSGADHGDDLPSTTTAITAMVPTEATFAVSAAVLQGLFCSCLSIGYAVFADADDAALKVIPIDPDVAYTWDIDNGAESPFILGDCVTVFLSHSNSTTARQVTAIALVTP